VKRTLNVLAIGLFIGCETQIVPASRVTGIVVTPEGEPIEGAFVELHLSVPVGVDGGELEELGTARSRADGTYEVAFPETRIVVNAGEKVIYGLRVVHPERHPAGSFFEDAPADPVRLWLDPRPPGRDPIVDDCDWLCTSRLHDQCRALSLEYFGSSDVCDFRY
jgi:hypothetical protein